MRSTLVSQARTHNSGTTVEKLSVCLLAGSVLPASQLRWPVKCSGRMKTVCCSAFPSEAAVFTASRLNASTLRIIGPGSNFTTGGLGCLLTVDEFFEHQFHQHEEPPHQAESLTYFLDVENGKHGIQVLFHSRKKIVADPDAKSDLLQPSLPSTYIKDAGSVETLFLDSDRDKGGAKVRVVAGQYESVPTSVPENFVFLDVMMRPGSMTEIPVQASHGLVIYILEGVGIINRDPSYRPFYENEGHGICELRNAHDFEVNIT
ncbi:hypothetical protein GOP47_0003700 [Adiantum capillus-veneris]|uniref:Uncharacterized protein n=1 Tax=Adiantum capillus-veneris TaxID=13818 RepID=A0A9D4V7S9_ADICA|nr:hypothetical protein GOP47_0003700 [Adiantum capillus-veneris]